MKREFILSEGAVILEYVCVDSDGQVTCYTHPDLVQESYELDCSDYEDQDCFD